MEKTGRSRIMVGVFAVLICALWSSLSFASLYSLDGYTGTFQTFDPAGNGILDTTGYYHLDLVGGLFGSPTRVNGLTGTLSLYQETNPAAGDFTRNTTTPPTLLFGSLLLDSFYLQYNGVDTIDLGSRVDGADTTLLTLLLTPTPFGFTTPFDLTQNANFFINSGNGFDQNGIPTTGVYGTILADGFTATYLDPLNATSTLLTPNTVDMVIDDTTYSTSNPAIVPEPSTFLLLGAGLAGFGVWRRRKV